MADKAAQHMTESSSHPQGGRMPITSLKCFPTCSETQRAAKPCTLHGFYATGRRETPEGWPVYRESPGLTPCQTPSGVTCCSNPAARTLTSRSPLTGFGPGKYEGPLTINRPPLRGSGTGKAARSPCKEQGSAPLLLAGIGDQYSLTPLLPGP